MKLDLSNFAFELSNGRYTKCTLGEALEKEFAIQCMSEFRTIKYKEEHANKVRNLENLANTENRNKLN